MSSSQSPSANRVSLSSQTSGGLIGNPSLNEIQRVYGLILSLQRERERERERETVEVSGKEELKFGGRDISATSKKNLWWIENLANSAPPLFIPRRFNLSWSKTETSAFFRTPHPHSSFLFACWISERAGTILKGPMLFYGYCFAGYWGQWRQWFYPQAGSHLCEFKKSKSSLIRGSAAFCAPLFVNEII